MHRARGYAMCLRWWTEPKLSQAVERYVSVFKLDLFCPDIRTQMEATEAHEALRNSAGMDRIEVDWHAHMVHVVTLNQDGGETAMIALRNAGFPPLQS